MAGRNFFSWRKIEGCVDIRVNALIAPKEPLMATCCVYVDAYFVWIDLSRDGRYYTVRLTPQQASARIEPERLAREFYNELLSNVLRYTISSRNQKIRECVVREALFFSQPARDQKKSLKDMASASG